MINSISPVFNANINNASFLSAAYVKETTRFMLMILKWRWIFVTVDWWTPYVYQGMAVMQMSQSKVNADALRPLHSSGPVAYIRTLVSAYINTVAEWHLRSQKSLSLFHIYFVSLITSLILLLWLRCLPFALWRHNPVLFVCLKKEQPQWIIHAAFQRQHSRLNDEGIREVHAHTYTHRQTDLSSFSLLPLFLSERLRQWRWDVRSGEAAHKHTSKEATAKHVPLCVWAGSGRTRLKAGPNLTPQYATFHLHLLQLHPAHCKGLRLLRCRRSGPGAGRAGMWTLEPRPAHCSAAEV